MRMLTEHAVLIANGGSNGRVLAGDLASARLNLAIVEWRVTQDLLGPRAGGLHTHCRLSVT